MKKPIFVIGLPRSGSTLWENIITNETGVFRLAEIIYLTPWKKDFRYFLKKSVGDLSYDKNVLKMVELIFSKHEIIKGISGSFWRFENIKAINQTKLKETIYNRIKSSKRTLEDIFKALIEEITQYNDFERCCVAFPVYPNYINELISWYPECKIIHSTRDPRAIAISKTNDPGGTAKIKKRYPKLKFLFREGMILFTIVQYIWLSRIHQKYKYAKKNYKLFKYEDLIMNTENEIKKLCKFIEIDYRENMFLFNEKLSSKSSITGKQYSKLNKDLARNWKNKIYKHEKFIINIMTKKSIKRLDFDPIKHSIYE